MKGKIFFGAYNKKIADEIKAKATPSSFLTISTMHAAGFKIWKSFAGNVKVEGNKCRNLFREASAKYPHYAVFEAPVLSLVSYAKQAAVGITKPVNNVNTWIELIDHFSIETLENDKMIISLAKKLLEKSISLDHKVIDFDDMIYAPLIHQAKPDLYDWVLIDEAQDTNSSRRALALSMLKRGGRLVAVGDRHQAIYGFTGADADSLDLIAKAVSAVQLPLTVTYRCPKAVVAYAQNWVSHITAHESAPEGLVSSTKQSDLVKSVKSGDAILCRFNAPLIKIAYQLIANSIPAKVEGREIGSGLKNLAKRWKVRSFYALLTKLDNYREREVTKFRAKEQESKAVTVEDQVECLKIIIDLVIKNNPNTASPIDAICNEIDKIFGDDVNNEHVLLSTIHKSKGREWEKVYWLQTGPSKWARMAWELEQEDNLCYVAATRAKQELILVEMELDK
jgi:superfamily I DNA/RNA helicase